MGIQVVAIIMTHTISQLFSSVKGTERKEGHASWYGKSVLPYTEAE